MVADVNCSPQELQETLLTEFPKLRKGGGFELLKCSASTRQLELIAKQILALFFLTGSRLVMV